MVKIIYIGNLPFSINEDTVRELFSEHGEVHAVKLVKDRKTKRSRGFGYVEMDDDNAAKAIDALDQLDFEQRSLRVCEARTYKGVIPDY